MNNGVIGIVFSLVYVSLKGFGVVGSDTYTWGIKDFHKCWSGSLAKRRLCLGPAGVINYTPLSALSFRVSLFPGTHGYNSILIYLKYFDIFDVYFDIYLIYILIYLLYFDIYFDIGIF